MENAKMMQTLKNSWIENIIVSDYTENGVVSYRIEADVHQEGYDKRNDHAVLFESSCTEEIKKYLEYLMAIINDDGGEVTEEASNPDIRKHFEKILRKEEIEKENVYIEVILFGVENTIGVWASLRAKSKEIDHMIEEGTARYDGDGKDDWRDMGAFVQLCGQEELPIKDTTNGQDVYKSFYKRDLMLKRMKRTVNYLKKYFPDVRICTKLEWC